MAEHRDPFERLETSHRRLRERLAELERAVGSSTDVGLDVVRNVLAFSERSVLRHEEDEEKSLFPRLSPIAELGGTLTTLHEEHARQRDLWASLSEIMRRVTQNHMEEDDAEDLRELVRHLVLSYEGHIRLEEESLFPAARRLLDDDARNEVAREMDARHDAPDRPLIPNENGEGRA